MKTGIQSVLAASVCFAFLPSPASAQESSGFTDVRDKVGYAIGINVGMNLTNNLRRANFDVNIDQIVNGVRAVLAGQELKMTDAQAREAISLYQQQRAQEITAKNLKLGQDFLAQNKTKDGVQVKQVTLPDGKTAELQYKILAEGSGQSPSATDKVKVSYRGTLVDGTEFDSTAKHGGQPMTMNVNGVIAGWTEALQMMKPGAKWQLFIPSTLAYGETPRPGIEPGSTLLFEVELAEVNPAPPPPPTAAGQSHPLTSDIIMVPSAEQMKAGSNIITIKASDLEKTNAANANGSKK